MVSLFGNRLVGQKSLPIPILHFLICDLVYTGKGFTIKLQAQHLVLWGSFITSPCFEAVLLLVMHY